MKNLSILILSGPACALLADSAQAQVAPYLFFPDDKVVSTQQVQRDSIVGFKEFKDGAFQQPSSPVVDVVTDGRLFRFVYLFNQSTLNVNGGTVSVIRPRDESRVNLINGIVPGEITGDSKSRITISGGEVGLGVSGTGDTTIIMSDGKIAQNLYAQTRSTITLSGGIVGGDLFASGGAKATMTGGRVLRSVISAGLDSEVNVILADVAGLLSAGDGGTLTLTGGVVEGGATAGNSGNMMLNGGSIGGDVRAAIDGNITLSGSTVAANAVADSGSIVMTAGSIGGNLDAFGDGVVLMSGGVVSGGVSAQNTSSMLLSGGSVVGEVAAYNQSTIGLDGINVDGFVETQGLSELNLGSGHVSGQVIAKQSSFVNMSGGEVSEGVRATDSATVTLSGGDTSELEASGGGSVFMTGGATGSVRSFNSGRMILSGGSVTFDGDAVDGSTMVLSGTHFGGGVTAFGASTISMIGGSVNGNLGARNNATIELAGGFVNGDLAGFDSTTVIVTGGTVIGRSYFEEGVNVQISGGAIFGDLFPAGKHGLRSDGGVNADQDERPVIFDGNATLEMFGTNLAATLIDANREGMYSAYRLAGTLGDGTDVTGALIYIRNETDAGFQLMDVPEPSPWRLDSDGNWSATKNWIGPVPNAIGATARFLGRIKQDRTVKVDGDFTVGQMIFDNPDASYTISARSIRIEGDQRKIDVVSGAHRITTQLNLTGDTEIAVAQDAALTFEYFNIPSAVAVNKSGPGAINATGFQFIGPNASLDVRQGTVNADELFGYPGVFLGVSERHVGKVTVGPGATLVTGLAWLTELAVPGGSAIMRQSGSGPDNPSNGSTVVLQNLSLGETADSSVAIGKLDINNNKLIIAAGTPEKVALLRKQLLAGRNVLPGGAADANWNGPVGIISSSAAAANLAGGSESRSIGYVVNGANATVTFSTFGGRPVEPGDLLVRYTRNADFNLDGVVNDNDVSIAGGFYDPGRDPNGPEGPRHWFQGDSNYNGIVDDNDISVLGGFYLPSATPISGAEGGGFAAVPEPGMLGLMVVCLMRRRRRGGASR